jgi:hypothetical protein
MFLANRGALIGLVFTSAIFASAACSASSGVGTEEPQLVGAASSPSGGGGAGTSGAPSQTGGQSFGGGRFLVDSGSRNPNRADSCAATHATVERVVRQIMVPITVADPVALYLMQDRSGSMNDTENGASTDKWTQSTTALNAFVNAPASNGLDVALGLFPQNNGTCDPAIYAVPVVPTRRLLDPVQSQAIASALTSNPPGNGGGTPLEGAIRGAINFCLQYQATSPTGEKCVPVIITDGAPRGCNEDHAFLVSIVTEAWNNAQLVTFAIGMDGADFGLMNALAVAGHSDCTPTVPGNEACNVTTGGQSFTDALNLIRNTVTTYQTRTEVQTTALPCEFIIPTPSNGEALDLRKVNVHFTNGGTSETILQVASASECASVGNVGWYYDNPSDPQTIETCPGTCTQIKAATSDGGTTLDASAPQVDILLGCETEVAIPH